MGAHGVGDDAVSDAVSDRYVRQERLGSGGYGVVWRAHDTLLRRDVALKEISVPSVLDEQEQAAVRRKVLREARAAARLNHPGLVAVYDVAEEDRRPVIVMELVNAPTLADLVGRDGPLDHERAAAIGAQVLEALSTAHEAGVIHRDVKPANVMVHPSGRVQLADFGVASIAGDPRVTGSGRMAGSPSYMSPEQAQGEPAGPATDLWGLGTTLYFAVEGKPPFARNSAIATLTSVVRDEPRPMQRTGRLTPLILDLLAKDPQDRPPAPEVRRRLRADHAMATTVADTATRVDADPGGSRTVRMPASELDVRPAPRLPPSRTGRPLPPPVTGRRRRPLGGLFAIAAVVVAAGLAIAAVLQREGDLQRRPPSDPAAPADGSGAPAGQDVPADWVRYEDPQTGFTISHPPAWSIRTSGTLTDFRDPASGAYLRVDHQQPPAPSPEGAWRSLETSFAEEYPDYRRIRLTPTAYKGYRAAIWEFTYTDGGASLHAVDLGFIAGDYGFALNFQTRAADWDRMQPVFERFKASFQPPS